MRRSFLISDGDGHYERYDRSYDMPLSYKSRQITERHLTLEERQWVREQMRDVATQFYQKSHPGPRMWNAPDHFYMNAFWLRQQTSLRIPNDRTN